MIATPALLSQRYCFTSCFFLSLLSIAAHHFPFKARRYRGLNGFSPPRIRSCSVGFASPGRNKTLKHKGNNDLSNSAHWPQPLLHSCLRTPHIGSSVQPFLFTTETLWSWVRGARSRALLSNPLLLSRAARKRRTRCSCGTLPRICKKKNVRGPAIAAGF